jgi:hypothetical protein
MSNVERQFERVHQVFLNIARAMFIDRLHVLRLTEIVRHQIRPSDEGVMLLPTELDEEMKKQAFDFVMAMMPEEFHVELLTQKKAWLTPQ